MALLVQVFDRVDLDAAPGPETSKVTLSSHTMLALRGLGCNLTGVHMLFQGIYCSTPFAFESDQFH